MRLHAALQHIRHGHYRPMEPWGPGEATSLARYIQSHASETVEFSFDYLDNEAGTDTLETFIAFANELWDAEIAPIPHNFYWVSWSQKVLDETVRMAAFCERCHSEIDNKVISLSIRVMFENAARNGLGFVNQTGHLVIGDHRQMLISHANGDASGLLAENGVAVVKALIGALATPQAIRREEPAPDRLNRQRIRKGKEPIRPIIVIDVRASQQAAAERKREGGWTVRPHWRRGHIRRLADGRLIPIPPACVNMETGVPIKPEYLVRI